jgi:hypothetical protein
VADFPIQAECLACAEAAKRKTTSILFTGSSTSGLMKAYYFSKGVAYEWLMRVVWQATAAYKRFNKATRAASTFRRRGCPFAFQILKYQININSLT